MSLVINNKKFEVPGLTTKSWLDGDPKVKHITDMDPRKKRVRGIVFHTHEGVLGDLLPGNGPNTTLDERLAMYQVNTDRYVSWDGTIDLNGDVTWQNDPSVNYSWHGNHTNDVTLGIELIQKLRDNGHHGDVFDDQLDKAVLLADVLTFCLGIQRQIFWDKINNKPISGIIPRLVNDHRSFVGLYGHRNFTTNRGPGDPGDHVWYKLRDAGYELVFGDEDKEIWKQRQAQLGIAQDGLPLSDTVKAIKEKMHKPSGLWVSRPIDQILIGMNI
jgi:hypothetical protein